MMIIVRQLKDRMATLKMMANDKARRLKLSQDSVDSRQADFFIILQKMLVDILCTQVVNFRTFENLKDLNARQRNFQARIFKVLRFCSHGEETHCTIH